MSSVIEILIDGNNVHPDTVDISDTADILRAIRSAVAAAETKKPKKRRPAVSTKEAAEDTDTREVIVSLKEIRDGSLRIVCDGIPRAKTLYKNWVSAIATDDPSQLSPAARASAHSLSEKARLRKWQIKLSDGNGTHASIGPDTPLFVSSRLCGHTAIVVKVIRVGGEDKRTATVRLQDGRKLTVAILSRRLTQELGERLYHAIEVHGEATWSSKDGTLLGFKVEGIGPYSDTHSNPTDAIKQLSALAAGFWDHVDPDVYVRDTRAD